METVVILKSRAVYCRRIMYLRKSKRLRYSLLREIPLIIFGFFYLLIFLICTLLTVEIVCCDLKESFSCLFLLLSSTAQWSSTGG